MELAGFIHILILNERIHESRGDIGIKKPPNSGGFFRGAGGIYSYSNFKLKNSLIPRGGQIRTASFLGRPFRGAGGI